MRGSLSASNFAVVIKPTDEPLAFRIPSLAIGETRDCWRYAIGDEGGYRPNAGIRVL